MVRDTLGEDAIIVATREERGGKAVHVTAAVEPAFEVAGSRGAAPAEDWLQYDAEEDETPIAEELTDVMLRHGVPEEVIDNVISCATVVGLEEPFIAMIAAIEHLFQFRPIPKTPVKKPMILVGAPGSGKTLAAAKIAARSVLASLKVGVISCDTVRAGGIEQLESFTKLLNIKLHKAPTPQDLKAILADMEGYDQIIIDTPGTNPFDPESVKTTAKFIGASSMSAYMVLAAGMDADESGDMARVFSTIGATNLLPTRVDIVRRLGGLLAAAHHGNLAFADAANTPKVADGLMEITPQSFTRLLMPGRKTLTKNDTRRDFHAKMTGTGH